MVESGNGFAASEIISPATPPEKTSSLDSSVRLIFASSLYPRALLPNDEQSDSYDLDRIERDDNRCGSYEVGRNC
ncbi:hypothetical protein E6H23_10440 [Candidatus Bathyarchaeota archaeon]|nr:MAG: hypothetical protein E6H23_10440 [Candidatus Bathyarchaeota archaeon]